MMRILYFFLMIILLSCSEKNSAQFRKHLPIKYFESENFENLKDTYIAKLIEIDRKKIRIDLNFDNTKPTDDELKTLNSSLNKISQTIKLNEIQIKKQFESSDEDNTVKEYISHHLSEIPTNELNDLLSSTDKGKSNEERLYKKIQLVRIGIYPQDDSQYAVFDYTIGENYTQNLIVVYTDKSGKILDISIES